MVFFVPISVVILLFSVNIFSMDRQESHILAMPVTTTYVVPTSAATASAATASYVSASGASDVSNVSSISEDDELCEYTLAHFPSIAKLIKPYVHEFIVSSSSEPTNDAGSKLMKLKKIKSEDPTSPDHDNIINNMVVEAVAKALEHKEKETHAYQQMVEHHAKKSREKYSGKKTASITAAFSFMATIVSAICTTIITLHVKK